MLLYTTNIKSEVRMIADGELGGAGYVSIHWHVNYMGREKKQHTLNH
jgi:hypothetical protein